jgi:hypothetical protein
MKSVKVFSPFFGGDPPIDPTDLKQLNNIIVPSINIGELAFLASGLENICVSSMPLSEICWRSNQAPDALLNYDTQGRFICTHWLQFPGYLS